MAARGRPPLQLPCLQRAIETFQAVLSLIPYHKFTAEQRRGLDKFTLAVHTMQQREKARKGGAASVAARSDLGPRGAASSVGGTGSESGFSAATAGAANSRTGKRGRRRSDKTHYGQAPPSSAASAAGDNLECAEAMLREEYEAAGSVYCGDGCWVKKDRLGLCRCCTALDDWKIMKTEYVAEMTRAEKNPLRRGRPREPQLPQGAQSAHNPQGCKAAPTAGPSS